MGQRTIDGKRLNSLVGRLLFGPPEIKQYLPSVLSKPAHTFAFLTSTYFILAFLQKKEKERIEELIGKRQHPFPGLIKPEDTSGPCAFRIDNARNNLFSHNKVQNMYSFCLGKNCTIILHDHKQSINTKEYGIYEYTIDLAYLISFGEEINVDNFYDYLEDLIAYSLKQWRSRND